MDNMTDTPTTTDQPRPAWWKVMPTNDGDRDGVDRRLIAVIALIAVLIVVAGSVFVFRNRGEAEEAPKSLAQQYDAQQSEKMRAYEPPGVDTSKAVCQSVVDDLDVFSDADLYPETHRVAEEQRKIHKCSRWTLRPLTPEAKEARDAKEAKAAKEAREAKIEKAPTAPSAPADQDSQLAQAVSLISGDGQCKLIDAMATEKPRNLYPKTWSAAAKAFMEKGCIAADFPNGQALRQLYATGM